MLRRYFLIFILIFSFTGAFCQQDVGFTINSHLLAGKQILKVKCDYYDAYVWVLAQNNQVFRINSLTLAVDDYTAQFAPYNNLQFIDIAGRSRDTVFVASNSTEVIEYKKASLRDIGLARGLVDPVTSVGMQNNNIFDPQILIIATNHGLANYNVVTDVFKYQVYQSYTLGPVEVFAATYRSEMYTDDNWAYYYPNYYPVAFTTYYTGYSYDIRHTIESGNKINTAFYVTDSPVFGSVYEGSFFWGNSTGLYQESMDFFGAAAFGHFLTGVNINKITDIVGLTDFYRANSPVISKDNLLVGTDNGLYFSGTLDNNFANSIALFSLSHFDPLGSLQINDVCVNASGSTGIADVINGCENGVWLGTADGVYLLNPNYAKYIAPSTYANLLAIDNQLTAPVTTVNLCQGETIKPSVNYYLTGYNSVQWVKDGQDIPGATQLALEISTPGE
jgi:hypothetical protein